MNEEAKIVFLRQMGYRGSSMKSFLDRDKVCKEITPHRDDGHWRTRKEQNKKLYVDKGELLALNNIFNPPKE